MECPNCRAECLAEDVYCRQCGTELPSRSLVPAHSNLPAVLHHPQLPRLAAGVGAIAVGFGLELLRRSLLARLTRPPRSSSPSPLLPGHALVSLKDALTSTPQESKTAKLPRGYEIHETAVYISRVIRRLD